MTAVNFSNFALSSAVFAFSSSASFVVLSSLLKVFTCLFHVYQRKALFLYAKSFKTDFFFQESHSVASDTAFWKNQWNNDVWMAQNNQL